MLFRSAPATRMPPKPFARCNWLTRCSARAKSGANGRVRRVAAYHRNLRCNFVRSSSELRSVLNLRVILIAIMLALAFAGPVAAATDCGSCMDRCCHSEPATCAADCLLGCTSGCIAATLATLQQDLAVPDDVSTTPALSNAIVGINTGPEPPPPRTGGSNWPEPGML